jgi:hypothetical protein
MNALLYSFFVLLLIYCFIVVVVFLYNCVVYCSIVMLYYSLSLAF